MGTGIRELEKRIFFCRQSLEGISSVKKSKESLVVRVRGIIREGSASGRLR